MAESAIWRWLILGASGCGALLLSCGTEEPEKSSIVINEIVPINPGGIGWPADNTHEPEDPDIATPDELEPEYDDFLELYNRGDTTVDLQDYVIHVRGNDPYELGADMTRQPNQSAAPNQRPVDMVLLPGEAMILWADNGGEGTGVHLPLRLGNDGDWVELLDGHGRVADRTEYGYSPEPQVWARIPDGEDWTWCPCPTAEVPNGQSCPPPDRCAPGATDGTGGSAPTETGGTGGAGAAGGASGSAGAGGAGGSAASAGPGGADGSAGNGPAAGTGGG